MIMIGFLILCNKLLRLKDIDICDITFLLIKHNYTRVDLITTSQISKVSFESFNNFKKRLKMKNYLFGLKI